MNARLQIPSVKATPSVKAFLNALPVDILIDRSRAAPQDKANYQYFFFTVNRCYFNGFLCVPKMFYTC